MRFFRAVVGRWCFIVSAESTGVETFAELLFTYLHELFDLSTGSLTKSQKLGLRASNSLRFAH